MTNKQEYDQYTKPIMDEMSERLPFITKVGEHTWIVQKRKESMMEAFQVDLLKNGHIVMSGDYDGVMVRPAGCPFESLISWLAGATTLSYFAEKVFIANQHHGVKEYSEDQAEQEIIEIRKYLAETLEDEDDDVKQEKLDSFNKYVGWASLECEYEYWTLIRKLESEFDLADLYEHSPMVYTSQLKHQHKCLVYWANRVLRGEFEDKTLKEESK